MKRIAKKIFISYNYDSNNRYKNLLKVWYKNGTFNFNRRDQKCYFCKNQ